MNTIYRVWTLEGSCKLAEGQPVLVTEPDMRIERTTLRYLRDRYIASGARPSPHTWRACAHALASFLNYLVAMDIAFDRAMTSDLISYRDAYLGAITPQGKRYSPKTVSTRIGYIQEYYEYLWENGLYDGDIHRAAEPRRTTRSIDRTANAHLRRNETGSNGRGAKIKPKGGKDEPIRPLGPQEVRALLHAAKNSIAPQRDEVIIHLGWVCGLRRDETLRLRVAPFEGIETDPDYEVTEHGIRVEGKGNKPRIVPIPAWLIRSIQTYINEERLVAEKNIPKRSRSSQLLLTSSISNRPGKPITESAIDHLMRTCCYRAGLTEHVERQDPDTWAYYTTTRPKHSYHDLRHTYAVFTYHLEKNSGNAEPWKKIQARLGHNSLSTTMDIYLAHANAIDLGGPPMDLRSLL